ncbi:MAG TPA: hypothetical protein VMC80_03530 [Patescibacteria group bacterium]|nr:hypothetical protein [Patescibacteria group bacterium]
MVNYEIVYGIKAGLERGQSLRSAMISFFNAGYSKEEIEEAARTLMEVGTNPNAEPMQVTPSVSNQVQQQKTQTQAAAKPIVPQKVIAPPPYIAPAVPMQKIIAPIIPPKEKVQPKIQKQKEEIKIKPVQKISDYGAKKRKKSPVIILLIILLIIFGGLLISIFVFKQQLIDWLSSMF